MAKFNFDELTQRKDSYSKRWDREFVEERFGPLPDDYISLWIADLDYRLAPVMTAKFQELLDKNTFAYTYVYDEFYDAVLNWMNNKVKFNLKKEHITYNNGTVTAMYNCIKAFCDPGDKVIINNPVYNPFRDAVIKNGAELVENSLHIGEDFRYYIDFAELEEMIKEHRPKVYIFCSPHNPGGRVWTQSEIDKVCELCRCYDVLLLVDEVHSDHIRKGNFISFLDSQVDIHNKLIVINSPNKPFNIAGLQSTYSLIPDSTINEKFRNQLDKSHIVEPNVFGIAGICAAYTEEGKEWLDECYAYILDNYEWARDYIANNIPQFKNMDIEATYLMWVDVTGTGMNGDDFTFKLAKETGVLVQEGGSFGDEGSNFIRINLGTSRANIEEAFKRIKAFVDSL